jgi:hypothetical protein
MNKDSKLDETKKADKYGVVLDSEEYLKKASVASNTDFTGIVPVAMEDPFEKENYEIMLNVPVGDVEEKKHKKKNPKK